MESNHFTVTRLGLEQETLAASTQADLILVRLNSSHQQLPEVVKCLARRNRIPVVLIQSAESWDLASAARACSVSDYLREPLTISDLIASLESCVREAEDARGSWAPSALLGGEKMVGRSAGIYEVRKRIASLAASDCNVLVTGETGTGKELAAELIHLNSRRSRNPLLCLNCAALPESLLESELFGYEKGAFTGAHSARPGQLEMADRGVLFLDEIGELSLLAQAKILRAIEGKEIQRLGRRAGIKVDVRIVCATNRDLKADVKNGTFRADLLFRLNVAHLPMPALRERKEDLPELAAYYFDEMNARMGLRVSGFTDHSWRSLLHHDWPGNVREFKNVIEASLMQMPFPRMRLVELPAEFHRQFAPEASAEPTEREKLLAALVCHNWNKSEAAKQLRWSRMTLYRKMVKYQLSPLEKARAQTA